MLRWLEAKAREAGLTSLRLETNRALREAQALYRGEGYQEVAPFNSEPYVTTGSRSGSEPLPIQVVPPGLLADHASAAGRSGLAVETAALARSATVSKPLAH